MTWAVIVPSRNDAAIVDFVGSLLASHPDVTPDQVVVVDDGLSEETRERLSDVTFIPGVKPFVYARNINLGAKAEPDRDLVICGDDVRFLTAGLVDRLSAGSDGVAAIAPEVIGVCGQAAQRSGSTAHFAAWLAFICVYIPRAAWESVGPLDERYVGYGYDDMDWCMRAADYGPLLVDHSRQIEHINASTFRNTAGWVEQYERNRAIFGDKWGVAL